MSEEPDKGTWYKSSCESNILNIYAFPKKEAEKTVMKRV